VPIQDTVDEFVRHMKELKEDEPKRMFRHFFVFVETLDNKKHTFKGRFLAELSANREDAKISVANLGFVQDLLVAGLPGEFFIWQRLAVDEVQHGVAERIGIVAVIETELELVKVTVEMFFGDLMPRTHNRPLEQREGRFDGVRVNVAAHVFFLGMSDRFM
jgi:hypothetical protein